MARSARVEIVYILHVDQEISVTLEFSATAELDEIKWHIESAELDSQAAWLHNDKAEPVGWCFTDRTQWLTKWLAEHQADMGRFQDACWSQAEREQEEIGYGRGECSDRV